MAAEERKYPINLESFLREQKGEKVAHNFQQLSMWLNLNLNYFDEKLLIAELKMYQNGDYQPYMEYRIRDGQLTNTEIAADAIYNSGKTVKEYK
ncbi:hypothetical protein [Psychrobacter sp. AOP7-A1-24]|uniref:hypothetical protein n=1 Tax=Psychrobacter sp. AOP7-A1-24 TaxID=3457646 RepID=UPI00402B8480